MINGNHLPYMNEPMIWVIASIVVVLGLTMLVYLLREKLPNLGNTILTLVSLAVAIGSLYVAIATYQKAIKDSEEQQKSLDASRAQLQAVVDAATKQQELLSQNLQTSKVQQELLSKSLETSKFQQEIQRKNLETSKAQLNVLEAQQKLEAERQARKPIPEIALQTVAGRIPISELEKQPVDFPLDKDKKWKRVIFLVSNKGNVEISRPLVRFVASPDTVFVDHVDYRMAERGDHNAFQFSGPDVNDIDPIEISGGPYKFSVDITVPDSINAFDLTFSIQGKNLSRKIHMLHLKVVRPSS